MSKAKISGRHQALDENKNEYMSIAQYSRALDIDFDIQCSTTTISLAKKNGKGITKDDQKKIGGKSTINYTQTVIKFFEAHPNISPPLSLLKEWRKKQPNKAKKTIAVGGKKPKTKTKKESALDKPNDEEVSIIKEKAAYERIKRQKAAFELGIIQGNFIHLDDLLPTLQTIAIETRQRVLSIVPRIAPILMAENDPHLIKTRLEEELIKALDQVENIEDIVDGSFQESEKAKHEKAIEEET